MTTSTATTEFNAREELRHFFEVNALTAFSNCIELLKQRDFYLHALSKIEQGADLTIDLPELKSVRKASALKICKQLAKNSEKVAVTAWDLNPSLRNFFQTYKKIITDEYSLLPVFEIEYRADSKHGAVKVSIKTFRRNLTVALDGSDLHCEKLYAQVVMQRLKA